MKIHSFPTKVGSTQITIKQYLTDYPCKVKLVRVHGDEVTAKECSLAWLNDVGGEFIDIDNATRELQFHVKTDVYAVDPNRIFTESGIAQSLEEQGKSGTFEVIESVTHFAKAFTQFLDNAHTVVALHNNQDFNITYYLPGGECEAAGIAVHQTEDMHAHDFILVNQASDFTQLQQMNVNVVLLNDAVTDHPGSLSEYCSDKKIRYFNIEAHHGHLSEQRAMLDSVMRC